MRSEHSATHASALTASNKYTKESASLSEPYSFANPLLGDKGAIEGRVSKGLNPNGCKWQSHYNELYASVASLALCEQSEQVEIMTWRVVRFTSKSPTREALGEVNTACPQIIQLSSDDLKTEY